MNRQLDCPNCQTRIPSENINIKALIAKCSTCNQVFNFEQAEENYSKPEVLMPAGIEMFALLSELSIDIRWRGQINSFLVFFTILWNLMLTPFIVFAIYSGELTAFLGISIHLLVGLGLLYYVISMLVNSTHIVVDRRELSVIHRPLRIPFYPDRNIAIRDIKQIYFRRYIASRTNNRPDYAFEVLAILEGEEHLSLVKGLLKQRQGRFIEQEIERFLNIKDQPVDEEW